MKNSDVIKEMLGVDNPGKIIDAEIARNQKGDNGQCWVYYITHRDRLLLEPQENGVIKNSVNTLKVEYGSIFSVDAVYTTNEKPMMVVAPYQFYDDYNNRVIPHSEYKDYLFTLPRAVATVNLTYLSKIGNVMHNKLEELYLLK